MNNHNYETEDEIKWKENFKNILGELSGKKQTSLNKISTEIGIDSKTLRNYMNGKSVPTAINLKKIADYFQVSTDYLFSGDKSDMPYSDNTITELASIIYNFDIRIIDDDENNTTLMINDKVLSAIIKELCLAKHSENYKETANRLAEFYGKMKIYDNTLTDYLTFENLTRDKYIYDGLEDRFTEYSDENGNPCLGTDDYTFREIQKRKAEWEKMNDSEREEFFSRL
ncbi:MAG: helix-turn-helix domain-containing protein [Oscillospiraceae bacterium]|nr:helix-turn-helix transcriptional regulator [Oscillospiraceae bacterium]